MLEVLLASRGPKSPRPVASAIISIVAHAGIIAGSIIAVPRVARVAANEFSRMLEYLIPPNRAAPSRAEDIKFVALGASGEMSGGDRLGPTQEPDKNGAAGPEMATGASATAEQTAIPIPQQETVSYDNAWSVLDVDSAAVRDPTSAAPVYPKSLMEKGIEGHTTMRFVVDSTGLIDLESVMLLEATHAEFVRAVREAMPGMRFRPARMGAVPVRQLAEQLFKFEIRHVAVNTDGPPTKKP